MYIVYFLQRKDGAIKIGTSASRCYLNRRENLRVVYGEMRLLGAIEGAYKVERELHSRFAEWRIPAATPCKQGCTEFFYPNDDLMKFIMGYSCPLVMKMLDELIATKDKWDDRLNSGKAVHLFGIYSRTVGKSKRLQLILNEDDSGYIRSAETGRNVYIFSNFGQLNHFLKRKLRIEEKVS